MFKYIIAVNRNIFKNGGFTLIIYSWLYWEQGLSAKMTYILNYWHAWPNAMVKLPVNRKKLQKFTKKL